VIHYHGADITPQEVGRAVLTSRHVLFCFRSPRDMQHITSVCQSFVQDNGAWGAWRSGKPITDWEPYYDWVDEWRTHPGFDWAAIPDVIGGTERENRKLIDTWCERFAQWAPRVPHTIGVPVWHPHESIRFLETLAANFRTVAIGGSAKFALGRKAWWHRLDEAFRAICDENGRPKCRVHGMRMLNPEVFRRLPLASADSSNVGRNHAMVHYKKGASYAPALHRAMKIVQRIEAYNSAERYLPQMITHNHLFRSSHALSRLRERPRRRS
jgi:hypothetical protein